MRVGSRRSAPPAATSERLTSGMPKRAPFAATIRSQASATSKPPATAKPSTAAMIGLRGGPWTMPAKPRCSTNMLSPATNAFRSMPEEKPLPAPVRMATWRSSSSSRRSSAAAIPLASAALTALRWSGRLSVMRRTPPSASVSTGSASAMRRRSLLLSGLEVLQQPLRGAELAQDLAHRAGEHLDLLLGEVALEVLVDLGHVDRDRPLERLAPLVGHVGVGGAAVVRRDLAPDQPGSLHPRDQARRAAAGEEQVLGERAHPRARLGRPVELREHLEPRQREAGLGLELGVDPLGEAGVGLEHRVPGEERLPLRHPHDGEQL